MEYFLKDDISAVYFGIMRSDYIGPPQVVFRLSAAELFVDRSESFFSTRFSREGYRFRGERLEVPSEARHAASEILESVPRKFFLLPLPKVNAPGSCHEY